MYLYLSPRQQLYLWCLFGRIILGFNMTQLNFDILNLVLCVMCDWIKFNPVRPHLLWIGLWNVYWT